MATQITFRIMRTTLIGLLLAALTACGNKGDLKPPGSDKAEQETASAHFRTSTDHLA